MRCLAMSKPRSIVVLTYWEFADALIQAYTLPYVRIMLRVLPPGSTIHLVTLERNRSSEPGRMVEEGIVHHPFKYVPFGLKGLLMNAWNLVRIGQLILRERIDTIHAWCTPAGALGYLLSIVTGRPLVIDSYEPHAEAMVENGTWSRGGAAFRILFLLERWQSHRAQHLIAAATGMDRYARERYGLIDRAIFVKPACVDLERFSERNLKRPEMLDALGLNGKLVAVYAGKFGGIYLDQEVFDLMKVARDHWGERFHVLLLTGTPISDLLPFMTRAGLDRGMFTIRSVPHKEMPDHLGCGDLALTPVKSVPTKRFCTPIKDGEYWALGLPVIITDGISDDSDLIRSLGIGSVITRNDVNEYRRVIAEMDELLFKNTRKELYDRIRPVAERYRSFSAAEEIYKAIYGSES